jgi:hypothetical protein
MLKRLIPAAVLGMAVALSFPAGQCHAQWGYGHYGGYGGYGWGGWGAGSTVGGSEAQGLGMFAMGAGVYNEKTAAANSINTDTVMRWNQYVYEAQKEATRQYYGRRDQNLAKNREAYNSNMDRILNNPSARDVEQGDALNAVLDQLSDPRIPVSALRSIDAPIDAAAVQQVPFVNAAEAISISLEGMRDAAKWPARLRDPRLDPERQDFDRLVAQARAQIQKDEEIDPETLDQIRGVAKRILDKLTEQPLTSQAEDQAAMNFAKTVVALTRMLEKPNVEPVLNELRKIEKTDVSHLLGFMRTFNLRFGPATTPAQRNAYMQLYPSMDDARDKLLAELKLPDAPPSYKAKPEEFFSAMSDEQLQGKKPQAAPAPPAPQP